MLLLDCHSRLLRALLLAAMAALWCCETVSQVYAETLLEYRRAPSQPAAQTQPANQAVVPVSRDKVPTAGIPVTPPVDPRRLAPQSRQAHDSPSEAPHNLKKPPTSFALPRVESLTTAVTGLAIVVGLFMICMWLVRRGGPRPTSPLPAEAVAVLGRLPLANRNFTQLLQVGNKLVLVAVTPDGVAPITEITDPNEVARLLGICLRNRKQSTTAEFQHVLEQLSQEPAKGFLGSEAGVAYVPTSR
ncbi:MAG: flagellar biosynthetic protein FliO [Pirellulales bacterium]|nr:flagellar biosynthetic protein FliO [Pirellulales bacterium]